MSMSMSMSMSMGLGVGYQMGGAVPPELGHDVAAWDRWLAARLTADDLATKPFTPLPVLGVPGWWPANQAPAFYDDVHVFRPMRPSQES